MLPKDIHLFMREMRETMQAMRSLLADIRELLIEANQQRVDTISAMADVAENVVTVVTP